jgi:tetratricopeptide (TPR) repeat protein
LRLILSDTGPAAGLLETIDPRMLAEWALASGAGGVLLIIDACYSGAGLDAALSEAADWARTTSEAKWFCILASAQAYEEAVGGRLAEVLVRLVRDGPATERLRYLWDNPHDAGVRGSTLVKAAIDEWPYDGQRPLAATFGGGDVVFLRNRLFDPAAPERLVEAEDSVWFTGRRRLIDAIVAWLAAGEPGARVLTGAPGSGKSALLDHVAALFDPARHLEPGQGASGDPAGQGGSAKVTIDAVVRARGLGVDGLIEKLAAAVGAPRSERIWDLLSWLRRRQSTPVVFVDGLDEAVPEERGRIATEVLAALSEVALVLIATRAIPADAEGKRPLEALASAAAPWDLDQDEDTEEDLVLYVTRRLESSANRELPVVARAVARRATREDAGFLYARLVTDLLRHDPIDTVRPGWQEALALSVSAAFTRTLNQPPEGLTPAAVRQVLTPLAASFGSGLPASDVWLRSSNALGTDQPHTLADIGAVLAGYGHFVVEGGQDGQAVYRLFHRELADHLLGAEPGIERRIDDSIGSLWLEQTSQGLFPERADPYLQRYGPHHLSRLGVEGVSILNRMAEANPYYMEDVGRALLMRVERERESGVLPLAQKAAELAVRTYRFMADVHAGYRSELALALTSHARILIELRLWDDAREASAEAVGILEGLAETDRGSFNPDLMAEALSALLYALVKVGGWEESSPTLVLFRSLADENPQIRSALAYVLGRLAADLLHLDRGDEALQAGGEAVALHRALAAENPAVFGPHLRMQLLSFSLLSVAQRQWEQARQAGEEAVSLFRPLAAEDPQAFRHVLATALGSLLHAYLGLGQWEEARQSGMEAVALYRALPQEDKDYPYNLATMLGKLSEADRSLGLWEEARQSADEAVGIYRSLAREDPGSFRPGLGQALAGLLYLLGQLGRWDEAERTAQETVSLYRSLAQDERAYRTDLAWSLAAHAESLGRLDRREEARQAAEEAVDLYRPLVQENPALRAELAMCLAYLAEALAHTGRGLEARLAAEEAIGLLAVLAQPDPDTYLPLLAEALDSLSSAPDLGPESWDVDAVYRMLGGMLGAEAEAVLMLERDERRPGREFRQRFDDLIRSLDLAGSGSSEAAERIRGALARFRGSAPARFDQEWRQRRGELPGWLLSSEPPDDGTGR